MDVVMFSGGKDSTAMLLEMIRRGMNIDLILCVDTGKEFPQMYEHIKKVKRLIKPFKVKTIKIDFDYWFSEHIKMRGKNKGQKGYGWPTMGVRWCTALKRDACKKFLSPFNNVIEYHGIAYDEKERLEKNKDGREIIAPLVDWKMTEADCIEYCKQRGFNYGGLYEKVTRVSCFCCPLADKAKLAVIQDEYPDLWKEIKEMETKTNTKFKGYGTEAIEEARATGARWQK